MTIHQPNQEVFELFDRLTLMLDGHIIFQDKASSILSYLQSPLGYTLPQYSSVSDFFMQILHPEHAPLEKDNRFANFISSYKSH
jgi:ABC-type multidrug transport system ATPase subunit